MPRSQDKAIFVLTTTMTMTTRHITCTLLYPLAHARGVIIIHCDRVHTLCIKLVLGLQLRNDVGGGGFFWGMVHH